MRSLSHIDERVVELWSRPGMREHAHRTQQLDCKGMPMHNFVGFNLTRDRIISAKVNHHHYCRLDEPTLDSLVPHRSVFDRFYPKWQGQAVRSLNETGSAYVLKATDAPENTFQFHFRFRFAREDFEALGVADHDIDLTDYSLNPGISFEYTGVDVLKKLYYYLDRPDEKAVVAKQFDEPWCNRADMLEYTQTDNARKVILWLLDQYETIEYFQQLDWPLLNDLIEYMSQYGCVPMFPGIYEGGDIRAVYFFHFPFPDARPFAHPANREINTLGRIPCFSNLMTSHS